MAKLSNNHSGFAAEYFVAAELCRRGFNASVTLKNTPGIDIIAVFPETGKTSFIQVKSKAQLTTKKYWVLGPKDEESKPTGFFYAFVNLHNETFALPDVYIVPANIVAERIIERQKGYQNDMREFIYNETQDQFSDNWDALK